MSWIATIVAWLDWLPPDWVAGIRSALTWLDSLFSRGGQTDWEDTLLSASFLAFPLLIVVAEAAWALLRWCWPEATSAPRRRLLAALAADLRAGCPPDDSLRACAPHLHMPYSRRAWAAADRLRNGEGSLPDILAETRIIPHALRASGRVAWDAGPAAVAAWCAEAAAPASTTDPWPARRSVLIWQGTTLLLLVAFFGSILLPRLVVLARKELGLPWEPPFHIDTLAIAIGHLWLIILVGSGLAVSAIAVLTHRLGWYGTRRRQLGDLLLRAVSAGRSEAAIASALTSAGLRLRKLATAGAAGDFAALCHACGWRAADPDALAAALAADRWRRRRRQVWLVVAIAVAAPLLLALPVAWLGITVFDLEIALLDHLQP